MKKIIITFALCLVLTLSILLTACGGNTNEEATTATPSVSTTEKVTEKPTEKPTETVTEKVTDSIIDEAESKLEDMSEDATHGVQDGTPGGHSSRGGKRVLIPRGK
jgi:hypothetical protein